MFVKRCSVPPHQLIRPDGKLSQQRLFEQGALTAIERSLTSIPSSILHPLIVIGQLLPGLDPIQTLGDCAVIVAIQNFQYLFHIL